MGLFATLGGYTTLVLRLYIVVPGQDLRLRQISWFRRITASVTLNQPLHICIWAVIEKVCHHISTLTVLLCGGMRKVCEP
jgi:hypothetical protein